LSDKNVVEILFKNGSTIRFHCNTFKVKSLNGEMTGYEYTGVPADEQVLFLNIPDIDCVRGGAGKC